ncbi:lasso peptide biosynthesis B2 protein [Sulfurimonas sp. HSL-1656]|uniref:lasso peptide biosynthesis B2 protein n=1 Tax=Thiomicrolovo subterrani TaxID=3131934 RepID=UPI0031F92CE2
MSDKIRKFLALSGPEKRLFLEAFAGLGMMRFAITAMPFKRLVHKLEQSKGERVPPSLSAEQVSGAKAVSKAVISAANNTPWESACLVQSLTAQRMLQRQGIPGVFYLGVHRDNTKDGNMRAHAWLLCGDLVVTGEGFDGFTVLSSFAWGPQ